MLLTTPGNPTGAVCPLALQREILALCRRHNAWLVVDETYEHFLHEGAAHASLCAERCVGRFWFGFWGTNGSTI